MHLLEKTMPKVATIFWADEGEQAFGNLLAVFGEHRGKIDVIYEGDNFLTVSYEDNCLDGQIEGPFDIVIQDSVEELMQSMNAENKEELIDALANDDRLISINNSSDDDEDFEQALSEA